jgi:HEAT repeat protein
MGGDPSGDGNHGAAAAANISSSARAQAAEFARGLARALEDSDWPVRAAAAANLHKLGAEAAEPHLARVAKLLHDESAEVGVVND